MLHATAVSAISRAPEAPISLGEGGTPLVPSRWIGPRLGLRRLYFKLEQTNPTGSYKDRFAARLVSLLRAGGHTLCLGTSSGNAGAAMAAYSAAAGIACILCVPDDAPEAKLTQIRAYGAHVVRVQGMMDGPHQWYAIVRRLQALADARCMPLGISAYAHSPEAMAGIEPLSHELLAALGEPPDRVFVPVGGGGLLVATWRGLQGWRGSETDARAVLASPACTRLHAVQAEGNDTLVAALHAGEPSAREVQTRARISGLVVPLDLDATAAMRAVRVSGGDGHLVPNELVWQLQALLASREGMYVEPAGAVSVAGLWQAAEAGQVAADETVVCLLTGHGYKDQAAAAQMAERASGQCVVVSPDSLDDDLLHRLESAA